MAPLDIGLIMGLIYAWPVLALALGFRLLGFPDLTVEGSVPLGAGVFAVLAKSDVNLMVAALAGMAAGAAAGALTAFIHTRFRLNKFLSGILVVAICYSLTLRAMGVSNIGLLKVHSIFDWLKTVDDRLWGSFSIGTLLFLAALLAAGCFLILLVLSTRWGMQLRVAGTNPEYARSLGLSVPLHLIVGLAATNALAALGGVLLALNQGFSDVGMGQGLLILALASMAIGERLLPERALPFQVFVLSAAILGSVVFQVLAAVAIRFGLAATDLKLVTALIVLLVVAIRWTRDGELLAGGDAV